MAIIKKIWKYISSMRFAILLLAVLALGCVVGSVIPQNQTVEWYSAHYSENVVALILLFFLDDAFHSWWFIAINAFLCLNLVLCNLIRLPGLIRRTKAFGSAEDILKAPSDCEARDVDDVQGVLKKLRMPPSREITCETGRMLLSVRNRAGLWGAWVCHLGILLLILGFALGQMLDVEYTVYGAAGQTVSVGDTGYTVDIDRFTCDEVEGMLGNYLAAITVHAPGDAQGKSAEISVNHPASLYGMKFYQNSVGRQAAVVTLYRDGEQIGRELAGAGDFIYIDELPNIALGFEGFERLGELPGDAGEGAPEDPVLYAYSLYYYDPNAGGIDRQESYSRMNSYTMLEGDVRELLGYGISFSQAQYYTLIVAKQSHFTWLALSGGLVVLLGLALAFYFQPARVWAVAQQDGRWTVYGASRKGGALFRERFEEAVGRKTIESKEDDEHA